MRLGKANDQSEDQLSPRLSKRQNNVQYNDLLSRKCNQIVVVTAAQVNQRDQPQRMEALVTCETLNLYGLREQTVITRTQVRWPCRRNPSHFPVPND